MTWNKYRVDTYKWHRWFAWYPVTLSISEVFIGGVKHDRTIRVWLQRVLRKEVSGYADSYYLYALEDK